MPVATAFGFICAQLHRVLLYDVVYDMLVSKTIEGKTMEQRKQ